MISLLLLYKIFQLFIFMVLGFVIVKSGVIKSDDSKVLSKLSLYMFMPSVIINSFDVTLTSEIAKGLTIAFISAIVIHIVLLILDFCNKKFLGASSVERASIIYSNAGNLIIPIVSFVLGEEWIIYSCAFLSVQIFFLWTHGICIFSSDKKPDIKKILCNVNIIAIAVGAVLMLSGQKLPGVIKDVVSPLGSMLGPVGMIIAGMLAAKLSCREILKNKRLYLTVFMRMIFCPIVVLGIMKLFKTFFVMENYNVLLISYLASMTPSAATVMQFAQITDNNESYATAVNIVTTLVCIVTMPLFVGLFNMI